MKAMMRLIYISLCFFMFNCNDTTKEVHKQQMETINDERRITKKDIETLRYTDFGLSNDSKKAVANWQAYQELSNQIEFLKKGDLTFFKGERTLIDVFLNDFNVQIPQTVNTNAIAARITVLETTLLKFNNTILLANISKEEQLESIKEFLIASANLNLQINKKFELEANNKSINLSFENN